MALTVPLTMPLVELFVTKTEKVLAWSRRATEVSRSISESTSWNSAFSVVRAAASAVLEAAWVARVASRSSRVETLLSACP